MYLDLPTLLAAYRAAARSGQLTPRYLGYVVGFTELYAAFTSVVAGAQKLDDLLHPGWRQAEVREPVFVLAGARSGTTLLHRLLCLDESRFTYQKLYQTIFPAVTLYRAFERLAIVDEKLGGPFARVVKRIEKRAFRGFEGIHPMGLGDAEEDEAIFLYTLLSPVLLMLFPFVNELERVWFTDRVDENARRRLREFYRDCLRRHLHAVGDGRTMLVKSVLAAQRVDDVLDELPDAKVIHLVRHPYESIPSAVSMLTKAWTAHSPQMPRDAKEVREFAYLMMAYYRKYSELEKRLPSNRFVTVRYPDLVADPRSSVKRIYDRFGWTMSPDFAASLARAKREQGEYKSDHRYGLEEFGLTREDVYRELGDLMDRYGFEQRGATTASAPSP